MIHTDLNGFLCTTLPVSANRGYTINAWGESRAASDHTVVVLHKWELREVSRKDLGNTMQLIRLTPDVMDIINTSNNLSEWFVRAVRSVLRRYSWYDENADQQYCYIPKLVGQKLVTILNQMDFFVDKYDTTIIDEKKWRFVIDESDQISLKETTEIKKYILWQWFGLCLIYGRPTITKDVFVSYKIQVPTIRYEICEQLDNIIRLLRNYFFVINISHNTDTKITEITTSDYDLLAYIRILYGEEMKASLVNKILDLQDKIFIQYGMSKSQKQMRRKLCEVKR
jgi:hypothetical protein